MALHSIRCVTFETVHKFDEIFLGFFFFIFIVSTTQWVVSSRQLTVGKRQSNGYNWIETPNVSPEHDNVAVELLLFMSNAVFSHEFTVSPFHSIYEYLRAHKKKHWRENIN